MEEIQIQVEEEPIAIVGGAVNSVNGQTGDVVLTAEDVGALPDSTVIPTKTSDLENDSDYQTGDEVNQAIGLETTARENADIGLQGQIDALSAASDVTDIVGTYADLQAYDTSKLKDNDIIKVLQDENQNDETTYYRWSTSTESFTLIGEEGPYYTKAAADQKFQDKLTAGSNITIDANNEISATDTTYSNFTGTDGVDPGTAGLVPAPATTDAGKFLGASGDWESIVIPQSGIPTTATFWGASYDSVNDKVEGTVTINPSNTTNTASISVGGSGGSATYTEIKQGTSSRYTAIRLYRDGADKPEPYSVSKGVELVQVGIPQSLNQGIFVDGVAVPRTDYQAANKKYVDTQVGNIETILQSINSGQGVGV